MNLKKALGVLVTLLVFGAAILIGRLLWLHYMTAPWTRDGRVRANIVKVAPDVSGRIVSLPVRDNQFVHKGDLLMEIDPARYGIAVEQAQAEVAMRRAELDMRRADAARRADLDSLVVSRESRENAQRTASASEAAYQASLAALDAAKLNLARTRVLAPVDGYITNLQTHQGDYAAAGSAGLSVVDSNSFWVYGYFEETKLPQIRLGAAATMQMMSGQILQGHVESIARGIADRDAATSRDGISDVNPTFNWVRLAQRVPVRIRIDDVQAAALLTAGTTCTVMIHEPAAGNAPPSAASAPAPSLAPPSGSAAGRS
ncbi:efflux RND transporter periplasmic adaptor subunit [Chitinasiproducens palmae]|uniref:RND family efflux transporter, MFP subunit n=1 Tax=Chitinasiproducens palmae TaxID=1770053 RepID=A0A1H2PW89_9BURK|nr:HlyD family secretion protein [Chitinasiproducens palmae]SDV51585.1 RND family efflux transporter, MFP subunit [Chitinasiproducens palmae]